MQMKRSVEQYIIYIKSQDCCGKHAAVFISQGQSRHRTFDKHMIYVFFINVIDFDGIAITKSKAYTQKAQNVIWK